MKYKIEYNRSLDVACSKIFGYFAKDLLFRFKRWGTSYEYGLWFILRSTIQKQKPQFSITPISVSFVTSITEYEKCEIVIQILFIALHIKFYDYRSKVKSMMWK